jgi:hypothetical protein
MVNSPLEKSYHNWFWGDPYWHTGTVDPPDLLSPMTDDELALARQVDAAISELRHASRGRK